MPRNVRARRRKSVIAAVRGEANQRETLVFADFPA
jgi:hypothetical protein